MATADQWREAMRELGAGRHESTRDIYRYAREDGRASLRRRFPSLEGDHEDLIHDVLARVLPMLASKRSPRAYFLYCLTNEALDATRKRREDLPGEDLHQVTEECGQEASVEMKAALMELLEGSRRDAQIYVAVMLHGEERETVAKAFNTTRENVDQVVSRTRKRLKDAGEGD